MYDFPMQNAWLVVIVCFAMLFFAIGCDLQPRPMFTPPAKWIADAKLIFPADFVENSSRCIVLTEETRSYYRCGDDMIYLAARHTNDENVFLHELVHRWQDTMLYRNLKRENDDMRYDMTVDELLRFDLHTEQEARLIEFMFTASQQTWVVYHEFTDRDGKPINFYPYFADAKAYCEKVLKLHITLQPFKE